MARRNDPVSREPVRLVTTGTTGHCSPGNRGKGKFLPDDTSDWGEWLQGAAIVGDLDSEGY